MRVLIRDGSNRSLEGRSHVWVQKSKGQVERNHDLERLEEMWRSIYKPMADVTERKCGVDAASEISQSILASEWKSRGK